MEEWVGQRWHRWITRAADRSHAQAAVELAQVQRLLATFFRAAGGRGAVRLTAAGDQRVGGPRGWLQRLAGSGETEALTRLDTDTLALPPRIAVFADRDANRDLYLWLAALSAHLPARAADWIDANRHATLAALRTYPGLRPRYARLARAVLAQRPDPARLRGHARHAEQAVQAALRASLSHATADDRGAGALADAAPHVAATAVATTAASVQPADVAPVWLWAQSFAPPLSAADPDADPPAAAGPDAAPRPEQAHSHDDSTKRRRAERTRDTSSKNGLVVPFRAESVLSWAEFVRVNRVGDDEPEDDPAAAADDLHHLSIARDGQTLASRVKFDLDLPSAAADDWPLGEGEPLPEWDWRTQTLRPGHCRVQRLSPRLDHPASLGAVASAAAAPEGAAGPNTSPGARPGATPSPATATAPALGAMPAALRPAARQMRRRFDVLRAAPRWQHALVQGEELDLDAWVRFRSEHAPAAGTRGAAARHARSEAPPIYAQRVRSERSLATLLAADLSLSTDAHATQTARVIDVIRDSLYVFGEALDGVGDAFEMLGFSSVRRQLRVHELKRFAQPWDAHARARIGAIRPGFYSRLGAAIRAGSQRLAVRPERQRLLLLLSDGKPNDLDHYDGRYGLEDTRHAVHEARAAGLLPFCVTIDEKAHAYVPYLFGQQGYAFVQRPAQLARALAQVYLRLTAAAR